MATEVLVEVDHSPTHGRCPRCYTAPPHESRCGNQDRSKRLRKLMALRLASWYVFSNIFFSLVQFITLLLFYAVTAAVEFQHFGCGGLTTAALGGRLLQCWTQQTGGNGDLFFYFIFNCCIFTFSIWCGICGHSNRGRCPREAASNDSTATIATLGGCGGLAATKIVEVTVLGVCNH